MEITSRSYPSVRLIANLSLLTLFTLVLSAPTHAKDNTIRLLDNTDLDLVSAGAATAIVLANAQAFGPYTTAGTGAFTRAYASHCNYYYNISTATAAGWAIATGDQSVASIVVAANVTGDLTRSHQTLHSAYSPKSGTSYASAYKVVVSYSRTTATPN